MRSALTLLVVLLAGPAFAGPAFAAPAFAGPGRDRFSAEFAGPVFTAALQFIAPRALEGVSIQQLALWGLRGVTTLDPVLLPELRDGVVALRRGGAVLFQHAAPAEGDAAAWGALASDLAATAWAASTAMQAEGSQAVITSFFDELFNHLDPYSRYVPPGAADQNRARRSGEAGAGLQVGRVGQAFVVQGVNADGPGAEAGIRIGDQITAVDDQPTRGEDLPTVLGWISGLEGTDLSLTVRSRNGRVRTVEIERAVLPPETVFTSRSGDTLVIRIAGFSSDTDQRLSRDLDRALPRAGGAGLPRAGGADLRGLVIDLRGNRGGLLRQAVAATDLFLTAGIIATTAGRNPQAAHEWQAGRGDVAQGRPLVVLVDGRSASAAEIMAAALADQGRGVVVGSSTLGKGLVQTIVTLPDGGELFVSWSRVLAPRGWPIQGLGVLPQICTSLGADQLAQQLASLERGASRLAAALARHRAARAPLPTAEIIEQRNACPAAEGRDADLATARYLIAHPVAYAAARLSPP